MPPLRQLKQGILATSALARRGKNYYYPGCNTEHPEAFFSSASSPDTFSSEFPTVLDGPVATTSTDRTNTPIVYRPVIMCAVRSCLSTTTNEGAGA